ncbi:MAG: DUF2336 domain-containing protein [Alphaproteobacteria bacterium]|nr:DUF2336 domain-containing protein [Alphaproteobacteria bacterium]
MSSGRAKPSFGTVKKDAAYNAAKRVAASGTEKARRDIAQRSDIPKEILYFLAGDKDASVRSAVARNRSTPQQADLLLATDDSEDVRATLAVKVLESHSAGGSEPAAEKKLEAVSLQALQQLAKDQLPRIRAILADTLKHRETAPKDVIDRLARDLEPSVALPILRHSPLLSESDLIDIAGGTVAPGGLSAVAEREGISADLTDALVASKDVEAIATLLSNKSAQIREETLDSIIEQAPKHVAWHEPLVRRPKLTAKAITALAGFVASALVEELRQRDDVDQVTAEAIAEAVRKRIDGGEQDLIGLDPGAGKEKAKEEAWEEVNRVWRAGKLDDDYFIDRALAGSMDLVAAGLALLGDIPEPSAEKMLVSQSARAVMAVCWRAGLSAQTCYEIQMTLARISPNAAQQPEGGGHYPASESDLTWQLELFEAIPESG